MPTSRKRKPHKKSRRQRTSAAAASLAITRWIDARKAEHPELGQVLLTGASPWLAGQLEAVGRAMAEGEFKACPHVRHPAPAIGRLRWPVLTCFDCAPTALADDQDPACDRCGSDREVRSLLAASPSLLVLLDLCPSCQALEVIR